MSFFRARSRQVNSNTYLQNRLTTFTNPHIYFGDLHVERDETIGGNLDISGNLTANSFYAKGNYYLDNQILIPAGTVIQSAAINVPGGWLECNGQLLNKVRMPICLPQLATPMEDFRRMLVSIYPMRGDARRLVLALVLMARQASPLAL